MKERTIYILAIIIFLGLILTLFFTNKVSGSIECEIDGIKYINLTNANCWSDELSNEYCPLPTKLKCNIHGDIPLETITRGIFENY